MFSATLEFSIVPSSLSLSLSSFSLLPPQFCLKLSENIQTYYSRSTAMDAEQENPIPDITPDDPPIAPDNTPDDPIPDQDRAINTSSSPNSPLDSNPYPKDNPAESSPLPPDLSKISEEINEFITWLLDSQRKESPPPDVPISIEHFLVLIEELIEDYDSGESPVKWSELAGGDSSSFLNAVNQVCSLLNALSKFSSDYKYAYSINRAGGVLQRAMSYLEEEFKSLLEEYTFDDSDPTDVNGSLGYSDEILSELVRLAKAMIDGGYESECWQVFFVVRRNALEEILQKLGLEKYSADDVLKMSWESLEREIDTRIKKVKKFVNSHLPIERKLCDHVFSGNSSISESLFISLSRAVTIQFLNFAEAVALTKRSAEKLFKFLDTYEAVRDVVAKVESLLTSGQSTELKNEELMIRGHLGEAMILIFNELESSIKADSVKNPVPGGAVHPLTKYIMNYLECAGFYTQTLELVFMDNQKSIGAEVNSNPDKESSKQSLSPFQAQILKIMDLLDANIEAKSKLYKDPSLTSIFMMNNGRFTLKKIKRSNELNSLLGETWYRKKSSDLRNYHKGYQRETWGRLLTCFNPEGLTVNGKVMKPVLKERFKSFNAMFDEIHKTQTNWVIADEQLQSELRVSISNMVIPAYRSFLARYSQTFTPGRQTEKYIKHQPEEIESSIDELFSGIAAPTGKKKQKE